MGSEHICFCLIRNKADPAQTTEGAQVERQEESVVVGGREDHKEIQSLVQDGAANKVS